MKTQHRLFPTDLVWKSATIGVALFGLVASPSLALPTNHEDSERLWRSTRLLIKAMVVTVAVIINRAMIIGWC